MFLLFSLEIECRNAIISTATNSSSTCTAYNLALCLLTYFVSRSNPIPNELEELQVNAWKHLSAAVVTAVDEYTDLMRVASMMCALREFHSADELSIFVFVLGPDPKFANELNAHARNEQFTIIKVYSEDSQQLRRADLPATDAKPIAIAEAMRTHELVLWMNPGTYVSKPLSPIFNFLSSHGQQLSTKRCTRPCPHVTHSPGKFVARMLPTVPANLMPACYPQSQQI